MLVIPKGKLTLTRVLVWCGMVLMAGGLISSLWIGKACLFIIIAGGIVFTAGAYIKHELFRCPKCGEKLLMNYGVPTINVLFERCPDICPRCSTSVNLKTE